MKCFYLISFFVIFALTSCRQYASNEKEALEEASIKEMQIDQTLSRYHPICVFVVAKGAKPPPVPIGKPTTLGDLYADIKSHGWSIFAKRPDSEERFGVVIGWQVPYMIVYFRVDPQDKTKEPGPGAFFKEAERVDAKNLTPRRAPERFVQTAPCYSPGRRS